MCLFSAGPTSKATRGEQIHQQKTETVGEPDIILSIFTGIEMKHCSEVQPCTQTWSSVQTELFLLSVTFAVKYHCCKHSRYVYTIFWPKPKFNLILKGLVQW